MVQLYDNLMEHERHGSRNKAALGSLGNLNIEESLAKSGVDPEK
jgi:hypothetical protein